MIMEMLTHKSNTHLLLIALLSFFCICCAVSPPPGSIQLSQQLLLSSLDAASASSQPFLISPSGTYEARLVRTQTDSGDSSCSILVRQGKGSSASNSNIIGCGPISGSHVCSLVFSIAGLGILDGMKPTWSTSIPSGDHAKGLVLLDSGDMEIISEGSTGRIAWKASESRIVADHNCGSGFSLFGSPPSESDDDQESLGLVPGEQQQQQQAEGFGNYPKQRQGRHSGFDQQPYGAGADDQNRHTDDDSDAFENGVSGRGLEIIGVVIVTLMYLIVFVP